MNKLKQILLKSIISIGLFYLFFRGSVWLISNFHSWNSSLQRGIMWEYYLQIFAILVILSNVIVSFLGKHKDTSQFVINVVVIITLILFFINAIKTSPYSILLPHIISLLVLFAIPLLLRKNKMFRQLNE